MPADLLTPRDVADRLGVAIETVYQWRYRGVMPEPDMQLDGHPGWRLRTIERWARSTGRLV